MGLRGLGHSKHERGTTRFILVLASEPYVQRYSDLRVMNAQLGNYNSENPKSGRGLLGAIVGFVGVLPS